MKVSIAFLLVIQIETYPLGDSKVSKGIQLNISSFEDVLYFEPRRTDLLHQGGSI